MLRIAIFLNFWILFEFLVLAHHFWLCLDELKSITTTGFLLLNRINLIEWRSGYTTVIWIHSVLCNTQEKWFEGNWFWEIASSHCFVMTFCQFVIEPSNASENIKHSQFQASHKVIEKINQMVTTNPLRQSKPEPTFPQFEREKCIDDLLNCGASVETISNQEEPYTEN